MTGVSEFRKALARKFDDEIRSHPSLPQRFVR